MAAVRPLVTVQPLEGHMATNALAGVPRPDVLKAPMRPDVVRFVHASLSRNSRRPYAVSKHAGHQTSTESCGVPAAPSSVSPASPAAEHTAPARVPSATCAAAAVCSPPHQDLAPPRQRQHTALRHCLRPRRLRRPLACPRPRPPHRVRSRVPSRGF
ncbi:unnamed protein product [Musa banksii]